MAGVYVIVPSLFTTTDPRAGFEVIVTEDGFKVPPGLPAASFAKIFTTEGCPEIADAMSLFATGLSVAGIGSNTVISKVVVGQFVVWPGAQTGTLYTYLPGIELVNVYVPSAFTVMVAPEMGDGCP